METGADATRFIQQYASFGLKGKIPLLGAMNVDRPIGDPHASARSAKASSRRAHFAEGSTVPVTKKFVDEYEQSIRSSRRCYGFSHFSGAMWVTEAIKKIGGKVEDRDALSTRCSKTDLTGSPLGTTSNSMRMATRSTTSYIRKVVKRADGKFWNVPTARPIRTFRSSGSTIRRPI